MSRPPSNKSARGVPVSARISPEIRDRLLEKHPNDGDISKLIRVLLQKYIDGRIIGVKLEV
jgi:hypothetical protein